MEHELYTVKWLNENYSAHFEELYKSIYKRLYFFARNFLMDEALADDIVQEVFLGLWNKGKEMQRRYSSGTLFVYINEKLVCRLPPSIKHFG